MSLTEEDVDSLAEINLEIHLLALGLVLRFVEWVQQWPRSKRHIVPYEEILGSLNAHCKRLAEALVNREDDWKDEAPEHYGRQLRHVARSFEEHQSVESAAESDDEPAADVPSFHMPASPMSLPSVDLRTSSPAPQGNATVDGGSSPAPADPRSSPYMTAITRHQRTSTRSPRQSGGCSHVSPIPRLVVEGQHPPEQIQVPTRTPRRATRAPSRMPHTIASLKAKEKRNTTENLVGGISQMQSLHSAGPSNAPPENAQRPPVTKGRATRVPKRKAT